MPLPSYTKDDPYLKRLGIAAAVAAVVLVVGSLLGPSAETVERWILDRHIGAEGPTRILPDLDIIPDEQTMNQQRLEHMSSATQGLQLDEERPTPIPDAEKKVPKSARELGQQGYAPLSLLLDSSHSRTHSPERRQEMHAATRTTDDFVLEHYVEPSYPVGASANARSRVIVVRVGFFVEASGRVTESYVISSEGGPLFEAAALEAVRLWEFRPIVENPAGFWSDIPFHFYYEELTPRVDLGSED